jgi:hypothetical protein
MSLSLTGSKSTKERKPKRKRKKSVNEKFDDLMMEKSAQKTSD